MTDLQNSITTRLGNTPAALDTVAGKMRVLGAETAKVNRNARDLQANVGKSMGTTAVATADASKNVKRLGEALQKIGGPGGGIIGQILGGAGLGGGFTTLAVSMGVAALAGKAFSAVTRLMGEDARNAAAGHLELATALRKAREAGEKTAADGVKHADSRRQLLAVGGQEAVQVAQVVNDQGIAPEDADRGVAAIYARYGKGAKARAAVNVASAAARVGVPFTAAADQLVERGGDYTQPASARIAMERVYRNHFKRRGSVKGSIDEAMVAIGSDPLLARAAEGNRIAGANRTAEIAKTLDIGPAAEGRRKLAQTSSPESAAELEVYRKNTEAVDLLRRAMESLWRRSFDKDTNMFGRAAAAYESYLMREYTIPREQRVQAEALFAPGG